MIIQRSFLYFILSAIIIVTSCKKDKNAEDPTAPDDFNRKEMLENLADNLIVPSYLDFKNKTEDLHAKIETFNTSPNEVSLVNAQNALKDAYRSFMNVSIYEFGPADQHSFGTYMDIYPTDTAQINSNINAGQYNFSSLPNLDAQGLPALDFLLFGGSSSNEGIVAKYTTIDKATERKAYLHAVSLKVKNLAQTVYTEWSQGYRTTFINATGTDVGSSIGMLVNQLNLDFEMIKSNRLGIPLGKMTSGEERPGDVEALYSGISAELALIQAKNIQHVFNGGTGIGFDDYLVFLEAKASTGGPLTEAINKQFNVVISKLQAVPDPLASTILNNKAVVEEAYRELQKTVVLTMTDMPSAMGVLITYQDNDGD